VSFHKGIANHYANRSQIEQVSRHPTRARLALKSPCPT